MKELGMEDDKEFILSSAAELENYLSSTIVLWRIPGINIPLSPGILLLALQRTLRSESAPIIAARTEIEDFLRIHQHAWDTKISEEILIRFNQWKNIIDEYIDQGIIDASYTYNVRVRVILEMLIEEIKFVDAKFMIGIENLDQNLQQMTSPGKFLWDESLQELFPLDKYSFLYLEPTSRKN